MTYTLNEYQADALRTASTAVDDREFAYLGLGVAGEAGEVADLIKKVVAHGHPLDRERLGNELGDVLWYVAVLAAAINMGLEEVALRNKAKLDVRYPNGFRREDSLARRDLEGNGNAEGAVTIDDTRLAKARGEP